MAGTFADDLIVMHDEGFSLPSIEVSLEKHLALMGREDHTAERLRLAEIFAAKRSGTLLADEILQLLRTGKAA